MGILCKTSSNSCTVADVQNFDQISSSNSGVLASTYRGNDHHSDLYTYDVKCSEFIPRNKSISQCCPSHSGSFWQIVHDFFIRYISRPCWLSMFLRVVLIFGCLSYSCFEDWYYHSKQKIIMKIQYFHWWCPRAKGWGGGVGVDLKCFILFIFHAIFSLTRKFSFWNGYQK